MKKYVALLRGINVGGNNRVEMKKLKDVFHGLRYENIVSYINSGNVIFESRVGTRAENADKIEKTLQREFGFPIKTLLREEKSIEKLAQEIPLNWVNNADMKTDVLFLSGGFEKKSSLSLIDVNPEVDRLKYIEGAIVWSVDRKNYGKSGMKKFIGTKLYQNMTARNVNTVRKLAEMMKDGKRENR